MVIVQSDVQFEAYEGDGPFAQAGPDPDLRAVFSLHAEPFTVVARADSGIATIADLRGKRVNIGAPGSGARATTEAFMAANGWTLADFAQAAELPLDEQAAALAAGRVDALVFTVGHPSGEIYDATKKTAARLVPVAGPGIDRLIAETVLCQGDHSRWPVSWQRRADADLRRACHPGDHGRNAR